jgi:hypothetical protein
MRENKNERNDCARHLILSALHESAVTLEKSDSEIDEDFIDMIDSIRELLQDKCQLAFKMSYS